MDFVSLDHSDIVIFFLPFLLREQQVRGLVSLFGRFLITSIKFLLRCLKDTFEAHSRKLIQILDGCECFFLPIDDDSTNIFRNQIVFFILVDHILILEGWKRSLYSLYMYSYFNKLFSFGQELGKMHSEGQEVTSRNVASIASEICYGAKQVTLEWTRSPKFLVNSVAFALMVNRMEWPSPIQLILTLSYYVLTEKEHLLINIPITIESIRGLEPAYIEMGIAVTKLVANVVLIILASQSSILVCIVAAFINLIQGINEFQSRRDHINRQWDCISEFRTAREDEVVKTDDNCSICLNKLANSVRVTPCRHHFHANCLRILVMKGYKFCPICKANLFDIVLVYNS